MKIETFSALLVFGEGNPYVSGWFPSQSGTLMLCLISDWTVEQTGELPALWDAMPLMTLIR